MSLHLILINTDKSDRKDTSIFKGNPPHLSLVFKWLHLNISFSVHFQTWAINHPYEHNGLCYSNFIIWIMSPAQVCINLCLQISTRVGWNLSPSSVRLEQHPWGPTVHSPGQGGTSGPLYSQLKRKKSVEKSSGPKSCLVDLCSLWRSSSREGLIYDETVKNPPQSPDSRCVSF